MHRRILIILLVLLAVAAVPAFANHSWGKYHWARTANPFTLKTGDNTTSPWGTYVTEAISDWNAGASAVRLTKVSGGSSNATCPPTAGRIEVCNASYGDNGWLGIASIWTTSVGGGRFHIGQGTTKLNDTYFNTATYNTPAWRRLVTCQELAHDFGLDHQNENFNNANVGSCMDYTNDPDGGAGGAVPNDPSNEHPNAHDFAQINQIYSHLDNANSYSMTAGLDQIAEQLLVPIYVPGDSMLEPWQWGTPVAWDEYGRANVFVRSARNDHDGHDDEVIHHVLWLPHPMPEVDSIEKPSRSR